MELFTACCRRGQLLLKDDEHKKIVLQSIIFLCRDQRIRLFGYVILEDEFHLLWEKQPDWQAKNIRQMMLKFTAQQIKHRLLRTRSPELAKYKSTLNDRHYHFWDKTTYFRQVLSIQMAEETIQHLHEAPVLSGLSPSPETYAFSSARFYQESCQTPLSPIADTYMNVPKFAKTYDITVIGLSDGHLKEETIDVPENENLYDPTLIRESGRYSKEETIDVPENEKLYDPTLIRESGRYSDDETINAAEGLGYPIAGERKSATGTYDLKTSNTRDYHGLSLLTVKEQHVLPDKTGEKNNHLPAIRPIYTSLQSSGITLPGKAPGLSIVPCSNGEKENSAVITDFRMAFKVLKNDSG